MKPPTAHRRRTVVRQVRIRSSSLVVGMPLRTRKLKITLLSGQDLNPDFPVTRRATVTCESMSLWLLRRLGKWQATDCAATAAWDLGLGFRV